MKTTLYVPDIECDSCVRVLERLFRSTQGITHFAVNSHSVDIEFDPETISQDALRDMIHTKGYRAGFEPFARKTLSERWRDFVSNSHKYAVEKTMLHYFLATFLLLLLIDAAAYATFFSSIPDFLDRYGFWLFYIILFVVSIGSAMWHIRAYKTEVTHMVGMMIGMTFGMQTGLMIGTIIGATNGMLFGSLVGMLLGVGVGWYNGSCCGIMGVLEGMMAGVMGGTMGAMLGVMLFLDHILWFMPFFMIINLLIMWGLSLMLFEEVVEHRTNIRKTPASFPLFFAASFVATSLLSLFVIYGPKTGLAGGV